MAAKVDLEVIGVIENMAGFTAPDGQRFTIFGEGGGQAGRRARRAAGRQGAALRGVAPARRLGLAPVLDEPRDPAAIAQAARGIVAATPHELAVLQSAPAPVVAGNGSVSGTELPVVQ